jgi:uncharacterized protein YcbK (DUF882 family)
MRFSSTFIGPMTRTRSLALALTVTVGFVFSTTTVAFAQPDSEDSADEGPVSAPEPAIAKASKRAPAKQKRRRKSRVVGHVVPESQLRSQPLDRPSGRLVLYGLNTGESADLNIYNPDGSYNVEQLERANNMLRCKRTDTTKPIEPRLLTLLSHVYDHFGKRLEIVSGYRNQRKQTSYHFKGSASDIRIPGVPPKKLLAFASTLDEGGMGIGIYPRARFVHIDVRPLPSYRWIDNARPRANSPDKQPPRGWKRKKLQS